MPRAKRKEPDAEYRERKRDKQREYRKNNPEKVKEQKKRYQQNNQDKIQEYQRDYREAKKEEIKDQRKGYREDKIQNVHESITTGEIIDRHKWDLWCDKIKQRSTKWPYSDDFTNDVMFDMMTKGCFYCRDFATTIDRIDSKLDHTLDNCVGCCGPCNNSKGVADPSTFIRKAYYRVREKYVDDVTDVWFENKMKPSMCEYRRKAKNKDVLFDLNKETFEDLIKGICEYCHRSPTTWFGIDRVVPSIGYVNGNVVTCCFDCNVDKHINDVDTTMRRNERIATRVDNRDLILEDHPRVILHIETQK